MCIRDRAEPVLQLQGEHEEQARVAGEERQRDGVARGEGAPAEQRGVDQRIAPEGGHPPLPGPEGREHRSGGGQRDPGPGRPPRVLALHERHRQQQERSAEQADPGQVEAGAVPAAGHAAAWQHPAGTDQGEQSDRHVHEEDVPPAETEQVEVDQQATQHLPGDRRQPDRGAEHRERPGPDVAAERGLQHGQHLRVEQRRPDCLHGAERDERHRARSQPGGQGGEGEDADAGEEQPPGPEQVTQSTAGDQQQPVHQHVAADRQFDLGGGGVQVGPHRGHGHVHDEPVHDRHERADHHHQQQPQVASGQPLRLRRRTPPRGRDRSRGRRPGPRCPAGPRLRHHAHLVLSSVARSPVAATIERGATSNNTEADKGR